MKIAEQELEALLAEFHLYRGVEQIRIAMCDAICALYYANKISREKFHAALAYIAWSVAASELPRTVERAASFQQRQRKTTLFSCC